jgi:hypothetical protein
MKKVITAIELTDNIQRIEHWEECKVRRTEIIYIYGDNDSGISGSYISSDRNDMASINSLREDIKEQKIALGRGYDNRKGVVDCLYPFTGLIACQEGVFEWDEKNEDYLLIGWIDDVVRRKFVYIEVDFEYIWDGETFLIEEGNLFKLEGQYVTSDISPVIMLVIKTDKALPFIIPYDPSLMSIDERDLAYIFDTRNDTWFME